MMKLFGKKNILIYFIIIVFLFAAFMGLNIFRDNQASFVGEQSEKKSLEINECYYVLVDFKSYLSDISLDQLINGGFYTYSSDGAILLGDQFSKNLEIRGDNVFDSYEETTKEMPVIVKFDDLDQRMRIISVDGQFPLDKEEIGSYPLCLKREVQLSKDVYEQEKAKYSEYRSNYYNIDIDQINSVFVAGEIVPARAVDRVWLNQSDNYTLLFDRYREIIKRSDLSLAMIENPLSGNPEPCRGCMVFVGDERNVQGFKEVGFDAMGIGNHFGDGGKKPLIRTIDLFNEHELKLAGASYNSLEEASSGVLLDMNGTKVAFMSAEDVAAYYWFGNDYGVNFYSTKSSTGGVGGINYEKINNDVKKAKEMSDIVIVMMSWGNEYKNSSNNHQKALAHAIIDAGADLIVGSHPHWVQEIELYKGKYIYYSLGNFIFDQTGEGVSADWSRENGETRQGISIRLYYQNDKLITTRIIPHKMCGYEQFGGESYNKTKNLAWKIQSGEMTYAEVDLIPEKQGCVWYQPTPVAQDTEVYKAIWDRLMQFSKIN